MSISLLRTVAAINDLVENAAYLGAQRSGLEGRFLSAVESTLIEIVRSPEMGGIYETRTPRLKNMRVWRVADFKKYLIFYQVIGKQIKIVRILHGARDIAAIFDDD
jgi:toxin ParE1/3/4